MIKIKSDKIIVGRQLLNGFVYINGKTVASISEEDLPADEFYDFTGKYVSPGFIDIHTHGGGGYSFLTEDSCEVLSGCAFHLRHGTTAIMPTVSAAKLPEMRSSVMAIAEAMKKSQGSTNFPHIIGAHLEGPYLSKKQAGAQTPDFITAPKGDEYKALIEKYGEFIARWTYAPENDKNAEFCSFLSSKGIIPSAGHSDATYKDMKAAIDAGCSLVTHLYSCTSTVTRKDGYRTPGIIESAFLEDSLYAEIIADGKHLPPELIRMIIKIKGIDKVCLVTDSLSLAGTDKSSGFMSGTEYIIEDGVCKLTDRSAFAGSIATADVLIKTLTKDCGFSIPDAVYMMSAVPAELAGLNKGLLKAGFDADIVVFDDDINVKNVFICGNMHKL